MATPRSNGCVAAAARPEDGTQASSADDDRRSGRRRSETRHPQTGARARSGSERRHDTHDSFRGRRDVADSASRRFIGSRVVETFRWKMSSPTSTKRRCSKASGNSNREGNQPKNIRPFVAEHVRPVYEELKERSEQRRFARSRKAVYGYFRCQSSGNDLIIYQDDGKTERTRFTFPRQPAGKHLCLADYFASVDSGRIDVVAFHLVTMGRRASEYSHELFKSDNYAEYLYFHGLSVEGAEALAELWHKRIREELGIAGKDAPNLNELFRQGYQGSRFSFGYPACPNLEDQTKLFDLLDPSRIDVELTEEFQLDPEQSTSAIIIHHPEARYFSIE